MGGNARLELYCPLPAVWTRATRRPRTRKPMTRRSLGRVVFLLALLGLVPGLPSSAASRAPVRGRHALVGSTSVLASQAGVDILHQGGNAVDAAAAVGFALAVVHPSAGNLGGGGLMVIRFADGRATTIDYRETAPAAATRDMFLDAQGSPVKERSLVGPLAAGVPGSVAGLCYVQRKYGKLRLAAVMAPAIRLAAEGYDVSAAQERTLAGAMTLLSQFPESTRVFTKGGTPYVEGDRLEQPDLARTMRLIAERGAEGFYQGTVADLIEAEMVRSGGLIRKSGSRRLRADRARAGAWHLSRPRHHRDAAGQLGRHRAHRSAQRARRLPAEGARAQLVEDDAPGGRDDTPRLCGSVRVARRSRFLQRADRGADCKALRRHRCARPSTPTRPRRRPPCNRVDLAASSRTRPRTIRSSTRLGSPSRPPPRSTAATATARSYPVRAFC